MKTRLTVLTVVLLTGVIAAQEKSAPKVTGQHVNKQLTLTVGVYQFKKPTEVLKQIQPALDVFELGLMRALGEPVHLDLRVSATYEEGLDLLVKGSVDLARFGPASYVMARRKSPGIELLAAEQEDGAMVCRGVIVVRDDSDIHSLADLRGRRFAFGDQNSTIGRFLAQALLVDAGIKAPDLGGFDYLDRHDRVYGAVLVGDSDAGALHEKIFEDLNKSNELRTLVAFENVGKPWIARAGLDPKLVAACRKTMLAMKDPKALKALTVSGFMTVKDSDYDVVRAAMTKSEQFQATPAPPAPVGK